ncbi:ABC transporter C member 13 [Coemansia aciculifera]|uniref:ABC transporter C member 13 n=1 Tax=Coemansia aciculifera TaxID=417176 RepID=A0A9W8IJG2_9FUNG|nr:ABC transporter C member 13 [Coemansia aciculifera]
MRLIWTLLNTFYNLADKLSALAAIYAYSTTSVIANVELVAIVGKTGAGKSSLLLAMCSEVEMTQGTGKLVGRIAYLEQQPWIMNDTLRANILFGREYDEEYYWKVLSACALTDDLEVWPNSDMTVIGENGMNISGGQRARLALARTVYSRADIYFLDDPLSALDAIVKRHILDNIILSTGLLGDKLRFVTTNADNILPLCNQIATVDDGCVSVKVQTPQVHIAFEFKPVTMTKKKDVDDTGKDLQTTVSSDDKHIINASAEINEFRNLAERDPEAPYVIDSCRPSAQWPHNGKIEFRDFSMKYSSDLGYALKNVNLTINPGEKIGIVGRTGAGKSSLAKVLFRLVHENTSGSILIDGQDISEFGVGDYRPQLGMIPQESTMLNGSIRRNLDPLNQFDVEGMWASLVKCNMSELVSSKVMPSNGHHKNPKYEEYQARKKQWQNAGWLKRVMLFILNDMPTMIDPVDIPIPIAQGLDKSVQKCFGSFSSGQQQLFGLCRVIMRKRKIVVLDEATANVDLKTDKSVQELIRKEFSDCTVLTIAHRLETIMNSDRIIVMDKGTIAEIGTPQELLAKDGMFAQLVKTSDFGQ